MNSETHFFKRIRDALGKNGATRAVNEPNLFSSRKKGELTRLIKRADRTKAQQRKLLALLKERALPLNLQVHEAKTFKEAGESVADIARSTDTEWGGEKRITCHDTREVRNLNLAEQLDGEIAVDFTCFDEGEDELQGKRRLREQAENAYIGVTGADWGVADCAAIALLTGPGKARATSLVPSVHIAILRLGDLLADLPELYAQLESEAPLPASFTFISGPSKTADIEAQLVHGAHGPRAMHLIVVTG